MKTTKINNIRENNKLFRNAKNVIDDIDEFILVYFEKQYLGSAYQNAYQTILNTLQDYKEVVKKTIDEA